VQTEEGTRVADLIQSLGLLGSGTPLDDVFIFVHINDRPVTLDQRLEDGDILDLHLPAMGG
jgi:sulfur carrier protein ThiS